MAQLPYEKEITGLVVIDPYNDFISEGGKVCSGTELSMLSICLHLGSVGRSEWITRHSYDRPDLGTCF
jgi:hypothetical protein